MYLMILLLSQALATGTVAAEEPVAVGHNDLPDLSLDGPRSQIVNGEPATQDLYPMTGGLLFAGTVTSPGIFGGESQTGQVKQFACSSTLIAPDVVLLAAHCVDPQVLSQGGSVEDLEFRWSRRVDLSEPNAPGDAWPAGSVGVIDAVFPSDWDMGNLQDLDIGDRKFDIALMFLEEPVFDVEPAVLITAEEAVQVGTGMVVDVVGWGLVDPIDILGSLTPPEPGSFAKKRWGTTSLGEIGDFEIQVGETEQSVRKCKGDSGGPTFADVEADSATTTRLIGVTSRSADYSLCKTEGGVDTRVDAYLDWIDEQMQDACEDGTRVWCDEPGILMPAPFVEEKKGGCDVGGGGLVGWWALLTLAAVRRRS